MLDNLNVVLKNEGLGVIQPVKANITPYPFSTLEADKLNKMIEDFNPKEGWLCLTNKVVCIPDDFTLPVKGIVLSGELVADSKSLHIRQDEEGWCCYIIERQDIHDNQLMYEQSFLPIPGRGNRKLKYEVYWKEEEDDFNRRLVYRPYVSRFAGFEISANKTKEVKS